MAKSANSSRPPTSLAFDERFAKEESGVRGRRTGGTGPRDGERNTLLPPPPSPVDAAPGETMAERHARIEGMVRKASELLATLPPTHSRARLLLSAILRRDEVLLDAVLGAAAVDAARRYHG